MKIYNKKIEKDSCTEDACDCQNKANIFNNVNENEKQETKNKNNIEIFKLIIGASFLILLTALESSFHEQNVFNHYFEYLIFIPVYILSSYNVLIKTFKNLRKRNFFDENFLMTIATIGAILIDNLPEALGIMIFYNFGELLQNISIERSKKSIRNLLDIRPNYANLLKNDEIIKVKPEDVEIDDIIFVKPGEKVPIDGIILKNGSTFDTSALTGESKPKQISIGEEVLAGVINLSNSIEIQTIRPYSDSSVSKIMHLVREAEENKAGTEKFITKFSKYYTPVVVFSALFLAFIPPIIIPGAIFSDWLYRALIFLVISCPCALVVSIPLGYFGGIGGASRNGILIKGANYLDILANIDTIIFDKTGTITKGNFGVTKIIPVNGFNEETILELTAYAESHSTHPIATSVLNAYTKPIDNELISNFSEIPARGIKAVVKNKNIIAGNDKILHKFEIEHNHSYCNIEGTVIHVAIDNKYSGYLLISDEIKEEASDSIKELNKLGIEYLSILSGDEDCIVEGIAKEIKIDNFCSELLPEEKVEELQKVKEERGLVAFIGDGINDAPVIANADVGIVMGGVGSDAAVEVADIVLMDDSLKKISTAIKIARKTKKIVWQNIIFVFLIKFIFLTLGAFGLTTMWWALFADVGVALMAILNASRILKFRP